MRIPFLSMFMTSPFVGLQEHAEKVKECAWTFQQAIECHVSKECVRFEEFRQEVHRLEHEADAVQARELVEAREHAIARVHASRRHARDDQGGRAAGARRPRDPDRRTAPFETIIPRPA